MVTLAEVGRFPDQVLYYVEQDCDCCDAKNYVTLFPGVERAICWNCSFEWWLPSYVDHHLSEPVMSPN